MRTIQLKFAVITSAVIFIASQSPPAYPADSKVLSILQEHKASEDTVEIITDFFPIELPENEIAMNLLFERLREGLVKNANAEQLLNALQSRLQALRTAHGIIEEARQCGKRRQTVADDFLKTLTHALESGLPPRVFSELIEPKGDLSFRTQAIIEAGERLHLAEVELEAIRLFMQDCRDRGLRRGETIRAARFWIDKHRQGLSMEEIRNQLWGMEDKLHRKRELQVPDEVTPSSPQRRHRRTVPDGC